MRRAPPALEQECRVFTRHILGCGCEPYVVRKYVEAHTVSPAFSTGNRFDFLLLRLANAHPAATRMVDGYARLFAPASLVRRKLVLLLAILETCAPSCDLIDNVAASGRFALAARLAGRGSLSVLSVLAAAIFLLPAQLVLARPGAAVE